MNNAAKNTLTIDEADTACHKAFEDLQVARKKYRAQEIGDEEYLKARRAYDEALDTWHKMDISED